MLDYAGIAALNAVIETQGFETAAKKLFITQSAISQRIKSLENFYGQPLLVRSLPYAPTPMGEMLLKHLKQVMLLENNMATELNTKPHRTKISIAISRDSLETWFVEVIQHLQDLNIILEIIADDQEITLKYLRRGLVSACVSTFASPISGGRSEFLGFFDYVLVSSPSFRQKYFTRKDDIKQRLLEAPGVVFDNQDKLHLSYLKRFFNIANTELDLHVVPSVEGFRQFALNGYAYALIPKFDILEDLKRKRLINLFPDKIWDMGLYWHTWNFSTKAYDSFNSIVKNAARKILRHKK